MFVLREEGFFCFNVKRQFVECFFYIKLRLRVWVFVFGGRLGKVRRRVVEGFKGRSFFLGFFRADFGCLNVQVCVLIMFFFVFDMISYQRDCGILVRLWGFTVQDFWQFFQYGKLRRFFFFFRQFRFLRMVRSN